MPVTSELLFPGQDTTWSPDRVHRYFLRRPAGMLDRDKPVIAFVLLNPSTADEVKDDPTVAKCRRYAAGWGYGEVIVLNAFAYRATDPKNMRAHPDPIGPDNDATILIEAPGDSESQKIQVQRPIPRESSTRKSTSKASDHEAGTPCGPLSNY